MKPITSECESKERRLRALLSGFESVIVAFSGGADSAYLAYIAGNELGDRALAVTGDSASYPSFQRELAEKLVASFGIKHEIIFTEEFQDSSYTNNPPNRCYYCKAELYSKLNQLAKERGFAAVCDGTNADDEGDYRPGGQAAREHGVRSPLAECRIGKAEIRELSRLASLPTWNEPASACLSSRIPYGKVVTIEKLSMVDKAENALKDLGFRQIRVRHHDEVARIEIAADELARAFDPDITSRISRALKAIGFRYVTVDLDGYRMGSLNESLK